MTTHYVTYYEGIITFYPEGKKSYGGEFTISQHYETLNFRNPITLITEKRYGISFNGWEKE